MHLSQRWLDSPLFYTAFCAPYNLLMIGVFKVREYNQATGIHRIRVVSSKARQAKIKCSFWIGIKRLYFKFKTQD